MVQDWGYKNDAGPGCRIRSTLFGKAGEVGVQLDDTEDWLEVDTANPGNEVETN